METKENLGICYSDFLLFYAKIPAKIGRGRDWNLYPGAGIPVGYCPRLSLLPDPLPLDDVIFHRPSPHPFFYHDDFRQNCIFYGKIEKWRNQELSTIQISIKLLLDECN